MKCSQIKEWLDEHLTVSGMALTEEIRQHVNICPACGIYYNELQSMHARLMNLQRIELTVGEEFEIMQGLNASLPDIIPPQTVKPVENLSSIILRPVMALAAVLVIAFGSWQHQPQSLEIKPAVEEMELAGIGGQELSALFVNGELDDISTTVDQSSITYVASQISPRQAEDILEDITDEEITWLIDNMDVEI